jgi:pyruvate dehydrogenase E1 component alpha subunit
MKTVVKQSEDRSTREQLAERVVRLRYWQHLLNEDLKARAFNVPVHLAFGHEAIAVAVSAAMTDYDQLVLSHRNVAYNLARAGDLAPIRDEYLRRATGVAGGRLGSMNLAQPGGGIAYSSSILGNNLSVACGLAMAKTLTAAPGVVTVMTGDGAMEEGAFYETLVFAKTHRLRLAIVIENNDMSMASTITERRVPIAVEHLCAAVDVPFRQLSGNDVFVYAEFFARLRSQLDEQSGPICVEVIVAALNQHAGPTPGWPTDPKNIALANGLLIQETDSDPLFVLRSRLGADALDEISSRVRAAAK